MKLNNIKKHITIKNGIIGALILILYAFFFVIYYARFTSFVFFDEYANILAGSLLLEGKSLYGEQFFNHQMLPVYMSSLVHFFFNPESLYQLILYHRMFVFVLSVIAGGILIYKLRWIGLGIVLLYEFAKYYLFGYLFLAEGIIVYAHIYLFYLGWRKLQGSKTSVTKLLLAAVGTWFVVWSREPYVVLAMFLYAYVLWNKKLSKALLYSLGLFAALSLLTFATTSIGEYLYQVIYVNYKTVFSYQIQSNQSAGLGFFSMFFYPVFIFMNGEQNLFRIFLMGLSAVFIVALSYYAYETKKYLHVLYILIVLGLANVRMVQPGTMFYAAFYMIQWYALFVTATMLLMGSLWQYNKRLVGIMIVIAGTSLGYLVLHKDSYVMSTVDRNSLFSQQYDKFYVTGQVINILAGERDRLFIDFSDSLLFWQAKSESSFKYYVYYPVMHDIPSYQQQRLTMFRTSPPEFYYTNCLEGKHMFNQLPEDIRYQYTPLLYDGNEVCTYVLKKTARKFSDTQLKDIATYHFSLNSDARE